MIVEHLTAFRYPRISQLIQFTLRSFIEGICPTRLHHGFYLFPLLALHRKLPFLYLVFGIVPDHVPLTFHIPQAPIDVLFHAVLSLVIVEKIIPAACSDIFLGMPCVSYVVSRQKSFSFSSTSV
jgi:hypothetical protein